eukprot:TRINITY_DN2040_c0_g1_i10.p2 TRINITY_DN2040_c0_g1~~TRINITY_DN2040_c0_g1_i10.p2  ORF type:complete len:259 (-),score=65.88 TRINITY_DN2040_c0_g1_i10:155-931(-)
MPREEPSTDFKLLAREIRDIKSKLVGLDNKITKRLDTPKERPRANADSKTLPKKQSHNPHIYPGWWGGSSSSQNVPPQQKKWEDAAWRKKHELDCAATARECLKQNKIASTKRPIKMLFDKKEFSRPYLHRNPNPKIIAKQAPEQQAPPGERSNDVERESSAKDTENYDEELSDSSPQMQKMVEDCVDSPIIKYFSDKYHETMIPKEPKYESEEEAHRLRESESTESKGYYTHDLPQEYTEDPVYYPRNTVEYPSYLP